MLPDRVSNPGPLTYESGALPIALRGPALEALCRELLNSEACNIQTVPQSINFGSTLNQR